MKILLIVLVSWFPAGSFCQQGNPATSRNIRFTPTIFYRKFSPLNPPALKMLPGDTVITESVDAGGWDKNGVKRSESGNPLTGPFFVEGSQPGDLLVITLVKVSLNRSYANTVEGFVPRALEMDARQKDSLFKKAKLVKWNLDASSGWATLANGHEHLQQFSVPIRPMLGCIGVAPAGDKEILTYFNGPFGGNLDFSRVVEGAIIYLPVYHEGALLLMGDGHAAQGDAELSGDGLETSMDFTFTVQLLKGSAKKLNFPHMEDSQYIMVPGMAKTLDDALKQANRGMANWLREKYQLSMAETSAVMNTSIEYRIAEVPDPEVEIVALLKKEILRGIKK